MKRLKVWGALLLSLVLSLGMVSALAEDGVYKIGILQQVEHAALDAAAQGFIDGLKDGGLVEGENLEITPMNASGDQATLQLMAGQLAGESDLLLGIGTSAVQALADQTTETPILGTAVTDYVAAGLIAEILAPGINVSGTTDMNPIDKQIGLVKELFPEAQILGIIFTSSEVNSQIQAELAQEEAKKLGMTVVTKEISAVGEVQQGVEALATQVDVIYIPTDNTFASAMTVVSDVVSAAKIPVITGETNMCIAGGLATYGLDYYMLGQQTAQMALRILDEGANPAEMPIESLPVESLELVVNTTMMNLLDLEIPQEILDRATLVE